MGQFAFLLSFSMSGIKNIENEIRIDFYKKTIGKDFSGHGFNVKAIYGENGSGKTAIVTAVDLLKRIMIEEDYLSNNTNQRYLDEIVNKKNNSFYCSCEFIVVADKKRQVYRYSISIRKNDFGKYQIESEELAKRARTSSNYRTIYRCNEGAIETIVCDSKVEKIIREKSANMLSSRSFISNMIRINDIRNDLSIVPFVAIAFIFAASISTFLDTADQHDMYLFMKLIEERGNMIESISEVDDRTLKSISGMISVREKFVSKADFEQYQRRVEKLEVFLKMFKPELEGITIDRAENKNYYECSLILDYKHYSVDKEFESTGIKRLIDLFDYFNFVVNGKIVFIDEMDANINDVYLCKLVEYFMEYAEGQLCFTTHNTSPMSVLKANKKSIDFLTNGNEIVPWTTNGHYSPEKLYKEGMIAYMPFNIEAVDFVGVLGGDED